MIEPLSTGTRPPQMDADETLIHDFAHETVWGGQPADATYDALSARFSPATALDLLAVCGYYSLLAFVLNTAKLPPPAGAKPLAPLS
jgi:4-carboxymuconolactone decarboxylase